MSTRWVWGLPLAALAAMALGAVAVQAATPAAGNENPAQIFVAKLAGILHLSTAKTQDDLKQAELQTVDQLLRDGRITKAEADALKQRIQSGQGLGQDFGSGFGFRQGFGGRVGRATMQQLRTAELDAAAKALHLTASDLQSKLRAGQTLAQLEQAAGVSDASLRSAVESAAKGVLDKAVKAGEITQAQEDAILQRIHNGGPGSGFGFGFPGRGHFGFGRAAPSSAVPGQSL